MAFARGRQIPWLPVVRFHKEIVSRAEQSFFSLPAADDQSDRWTSLEEFAPSEFGGPWQVDQAALRSQSFRIAFEQGQHESLYLGAACYLAFEKVGNNWIPQWRPLLYREVRLRREGPALEIVPEQGKWSLSPLFLSLLERREVHLAESPEEFTSRLIERSAAIRALDAEVGLGPAVHSAVAELAPEVRDDLCRSAKKSDLPCPPSSWVLFAPVNTVSALTQHLVRDYERLENLLAQRPGEIGGLRLLEDSPTSGQIEQLEVLPLVPLNPMQKNAVSSILEGRPLTVISGPPGTGKSQVVVSLLLNAWAAGRTVLFASNNNKAVDVVRERVERFESNFPVAVRAGARSKQNIQEVLRRTLNMASGAPETVGVTGKGGKSASKRVEKLRRERDALGDQLESELPQRIAEAHKAALQAYGRNQQQLADIATLRAELEAERDALGLAGWSAERVERALAETDAWLARVRHYRLVVEHEEVQRQNLQNETKLRLRARDEILESIGLPPSEFGDERWTPDEPAIAAVETWLRQMQGALAGPVETLAGPLAWAAEFDRWRSAVEAREWSGRARRLASWLRQSCRGLGAIQLEANRAREAFDAWRLRLEDAGIPADLAVKGEALEEWTALYLELRTRRGNLLDKAPWSRAARLRRELDKVERILRPAFPLRIWGKIGALDESGRDKLAPLIELARSWLSFKLANADATKHTKALDDARAHLSKECAALRVPGPADGFDEDGWQRLADRLDAESEIAGRCIVAWERRSAKEAAEENLRSLAHEWAQLASGVPVWESWRCKDGAELDRAVGDLTETVDPTRVSKVRKSLYSGSLTSMLGLWRSAAARHEEAERLRRELSQTPKPRDRFESWWSERPADALLLRVMPIEWPDAASESGTLDPVRGWCKEWTNFDQVVRPEKEIDAARDLDRAIGRLTHAFSLLPPSDELSRGKRIIDQVRSDPTGEWPIDEIEDTLAAFSPDRITAKRERIESELESLAFDGAKSRWLERLASDSDALRAIDEIERAVRQNGGQVPERLYEAFREALRLVPIWITTAQAAQAIPLIPELFDLVVIDEASQCTLTNLLPLVYRAKSLAVIGDENQLPAIPTIHEAEELSLAGKHGIEEYLYLVGHASNDVYKAATQSLPRRRADVLMLTEHFRSHPQIIGFSNRHVYLQRLELRKNPHATQALPIGSGVHLVAVSGVARHGSSGRSWWNANEIEEVVRLVQSLRHGPARSLSLGVVTPFAEQKERLRKILDEQGFSSEVLVDTANGFQGDERDVIIFSPVAARGMTPGAVRWVETPPNLVNVALTRAREALYVVCDVDFCLQQDGILKKLALYCREVELLRSTSLAELELFSWMVVKGWEPRVHPRIGDLEVDFVLNAPNADRLAIEVDGAQHSAAPERDRARDAYLRGQGYAVERFSAQEVLETPYEVIHRIAQRMQVEA